MGYWYWKDQRAKAAVALKTATDTGLVAYWSFDEGSGTTAEDFSPANANTGNLTNGPTWTTGQIGGAVSFDGTDDYVNTTSTYRYESLYCLFMGVSTIEWIVSADYYNAFWEYA